MRLPALILVCATGTLTAAEPLPAVIDFNRDIRPILADTCYTCHGPDNNQREAKLRLDQREGRQVAGALGLHCAETAVVAKG